MPKELEKASSARVTMDLASANADLQMAVYITQENFDGMSRWLKSQASDERAHADLSLPAIPNAFNITAIQHLRSQLRVAKCRQLENV